MEQKYIILELIPTARNPEKGDIIQLSALKIDHLNLVDRFDYRLNEQFIPLQDLIDMISYDKDKFAYKDTTEEILQAFGDWVQDYPLLILNNQYTLDYLKSIKNIKKDISTYLDIPYHDDIIDTIMKKYNIQPTNYIVDILYEALINKSND